LAEVEVIDVTDWTLPLSAEDIRRLLPHRYPFLLVDRVTELEPGKRAVGYKMVTANEPHFTGHFPEYMLMPGVLIAEAMAQLGGVALLALPELKGRRPMLTGLDGVRFRGQVRPGDRLDMQVEIDRLRGSMGRGYGEAFVDGQKVCEGTILFALA
jgi:3-hydroxyacyl-[acyl-carrier-protein] dehydratase